MKLKVLSKTGIFVPEMLKFEILSKLPVKSLTRFKLVCRDWSSSFHTKLFITKHHQNNLRNNHLNLLLKRSHGNTHDDIYYFSQLSTEKGQNFSVNHNIRLPFFENNFYAPLIYGPCNGLLCLHEFAKVALWNPSTRELKTLSQSSVQRPPNLGYTAFGLCFGFGYDPQTDDYKIVRFVVNYVVDDGYEDSTQVELYSLKSDSMTEIVVPYEGPYGGVVFNTYVNEFYYWQALGDSGELVLAFDMADEKFSTLPMTEFFSGELV
ncbi:F-box/kelch-repeat protein At3g23880-like [Hibiscus syriacus]|uniref:F-box/kelch-repeat protein At3g23880-like n=1 Tax=Hibiscus syriacus TaxID=106335 RepID=UPI00192148E2|nr:F-box/kelch-repeat protein At3g23880-like [Hibiscus syriacus]